jgi:hypothetical protein
MSNYRKFWLKHNILRTISAAGFLLFFPIAMTVVLWIEYWKEDVKSTFVRLIEIIKDWRTE